MHGTGAWHWALAQHQYQKEGDMVHTGTSTGTGTSTLAAHQYQKEGGGTIHCTALVQLQRIDARGASGHFGPSAYYCSRSHAIVGMMKTIKCQSWLRLPLYFLVAGLSIICSKNEAFCVPFYQDARKDLRSSSTL